MYFLNFCSFIAFAVHTALRNWKKLTQGVLQERIRDEVSLPKANIDFIH